MDGKTENKNNYDLNDDKTAVFGSRELEEILFASDNELTVADPLPRGSSEFDLESILSEAEGYKLEQEELTRVIPPVPERKKAEPSENAQRVLEEKAEEQQHKKKKRVIMICTGVVLALAVLLAVVLMMKSSSRSKEYNDAYNAAKLYYYDGEYDKALEELRRAMAIDKTDDCLLLMSECYEAKCDYTNAISILESSNSGSEIIKKRIEKLKTAAAEYELGKVVLICGEQYPTDTADLELSGQKLRSGRLGDICKLTELTRLDLSDNEITDLDFLTGLDKLVSLDLSNNYISDLSPLSALSSLRTLHLDNNADIKDLAPLYKLQNLTMLTISGIEITESKLNELKENLPGCLISSDEASADVLDITLGGKTFKSDVTKLSLCDCGIVDISVLSICVNLTELDLSGNYIRDISPLLDIPNLVVLDLSENSISDIRPLMSMTTVEHLNLAGNEISSIAALSQLTSLKELVLNGNAISGTQSLSQLGSLKVLGLKNTGIRDEDLENLYSLTGLQKLTLEGNSALTETGVDALKAKLTKCKISCSELLKRIDLGGREFEPYAETVEAKGLGISDLSAVSGFRELKHLDLSGNIITSVSELAQLQTLESLDLSDNNISDVTPLYALKGLKQLWLSDNSLTEDQITALKEALPECTIIFE